MATNCPEKMTPKKSKTKKHDLVDTIAYWDDEFRECADGWGRDVVDMFKGNYGIDAPIRAIVSLLSEINYRLTSIMIATGSYEKIDKLGKQCNLLKGNKK